MSNSRTITISLDHLVAEMVAYPFVATGALATPVTELVIDLNNGTGDLWRQAERHFVAHFPHLSLDEMVSLRNWAWFDGWDGARTSLSLAQLLRCTAERFLVARGPVAEPRLPDGVNVRESADPAARRAWCWMTLALPVDLLLAGLWRCGEGPARINTLAPALEVVLRERGYAETHVHAGAALDFPTLWASAVNWVARAGDGRSGMPYDAFKSPGAEHDEGRLLASWLVRAAIVRFLLGRFLKLRGKRDSWESFVASVLSTGPYSSVQRDDVDRAIDDLRKGVLSVTASDGPNLKSQFASLQGTYNAITQASLRPVPKRLAEVQQCDPLSEVFPAGVEGVPSVQLQFLAAGLEYLVERKSDRAFAELFWQVERVRGQVYRHVIQRPLTPGLMNFIRVYDRKAAAAELLENVEVESSGVLGGVGRGLRALEIRTSPKSDYDAQLKQIKRLRQTFVKLKNADSAADSKGWRQLECGLALHFLKVRSKTLGEGRPPAFELDHHADPAGRENPMRYRWQSFFQQRYAQAQALGEAIKREPTVLWFLRAIDVCTDEHGVPTWVIAPLFHRVREQAFEAARRHRQETGVELPPLRTTAHVGEDFVHLATGLRYMDEALEHLPLRCGDRAGHGLALGVRPDTWARKAMRLAMPREDRWFDLIWERRWHARPGAEFGNARTAFVDDEIGRLGRLIFGAGPDWTPARAIQFVDQLYSLLSLRALGFPNQPLGVRPIGDSPQAALVWYLTSSSLYHRSRAIEWVQADEDGAAVAELQRLVRKRYAETGVTIEVNPMSNLLVGDLTDLKEHPLWRLAPQLGQQFGPTLRLCVGSDDPLPFATNLPQEYQFLYDSLVLANRSHADARAWIEHIRELGLESRFTVTASFP